MAKSLFLVTGATGTTGRVAVAELTRRGHQVRAFVHADDDRAWRLRSLGAEKVVSPPALFKSGAALVKSKLAIAEWA